MQISDDSQRPVEGGTTGSIQALQKTVHFLRSLESIALDHFRERSSSVTVKADSELVGALDLYIQEQLRNRLESDGFRVIGEESIEHDYDLRAGDLVLVDPVDGTHNFMLGLPTFGCMCTFIRHGVVWGSVIWLPVEQELAIGGLYTAVRGQGAWLHLAENASRRLNVSTTKELANAFIALEGKTERIAASTAARKLTCASLRTRSGLSSCWAGTRLAQGSSTLTSLDAVLCIESKPWDTLPIALLVQEAGGCVTDLLGNPWSVANCSTVLLTNGLLHQQALGVTSELEEAAV